MLAPGHRAEAVGLLGQKLKLGHEVAQRTHAQLADPSFGFTPDARFDPEGFENMLALRAEVQGGKGADQAAIHRAVDLGYYERAMKMAPP